MSNIFEERTFNEEEKADFKLVVDDCVEVLNQIEDLNNHLKENTKSLCDKLNYNLNDNSQKVKPALIIKMAKAKIKQKEDLERSKVAISEVEDGLQCIYHL